jgi:hypothetical protein
MNLMSFAGHGYMRPSPTETPMSTTPTNETTTAGTASPATTTPSPDRQQRRLAEALKRVSRFADRAAAFRYAAHPGTPLRVLLGDDGRFWAATPADAARLERAGYEYAD